MSKFLAALFFLGLLLFNTTTSAGFACQNDADGANDLPGQSDITQACYNFDGLSDPDPSYIITVNFDDTGFPGKNTGDGCALFDTDADVLGFIDYAICFQIGDNPAELEPGSPFAYQCTSPNDNDSCGGATLITLTNTSCSVSLSNDDPFLSGDDYPGDSKVTCTIDTDDIPSGGLQVNACTYPSASPTSDPKDCISSAGDGQIFIVKDAFPNDTTDFSFNTTSVTVNRNDIITGDGATFFDVTPGTFSISETVPDNWGLTGIECRDRNNNVVGTVDLATGTVSGLLITLTDRTICTFTNRKQADITITKDDATGNFTPGATQTYSIAVTNNGPANLAGAVINDTIPDGATIDSVACNAGATCSITSTGQDIAITLDIDNGETVIVSVQVTYSTNPANY